MNFFNELVRSKCNTGDINNIPSLESKLDGTTKFLIVGSLVMGYILIKK